MSQTHQNAKRVYEADAAPSDAIVFVNWIKARNLRGFLQMYRFAPAVNRMLQRARGQGLFDARVSIVSPTELLVVSYWENEDALRASFRDEAHVRMMRYTFQHPDDLILGNETYQQPISTRYVNEAGGYALVRPAADL